MRQCNGLHKGGNFKATKAYCSYRYKSSNRRTKHSASGDLLGTLLFAAIALPVVDALSKIEEAPKQEATTEQATGAIYVLIGILVLVSFCCISVFANM